MSATSTGILGALLAFQAEAPTLPKDATNPHFRSKFTPLDTIVEHVQPLLTKHGLTWSTFPCRDEHGPALRYVLGHADTGVTMEGTMPLLSSKQDPQGQGSAITYARRYSICAVLNLVADEDDDGNGGSGGQQQGGGVDKDAERPAAPRIPVDRAKLILDAAIAAGLASVDDGGQNYGFTPVLKAQLATLGVQKIGELNVDQAEAVEAFIAVEFNEQQDAPRG